MENSRDRGRTESSGPVFEGGTYTRQSVHGREHALSPRTTLPLCVQWDPWVVSPRRDREGHEGVPEDPLRDPLGILYPKGHRTGRRVRMISPT